jgi:hypothetical protein
MSAGSGSPVAAALLELLELDVLVALDELGSVASLVPVPLPTGVEVPEPTPVPVFASVLALDGGTVNPTNAEPVPEPSWADASTWPKSVVEFGLEHASMRAAAARVQ